MSLRILTTEDVDTILDDFQPQDLQRLMAQVFSQFSIRKSEIEMPHRLSIQNPHHTALFMPARIGSLGASSTGVTAVKVVSVPKGDAAAGLPSTTLILDENTGSVKAIVNSRRLTAIRNAAGSLLSTSLMKVTPRSIVAFGTGQQIEAHIDLHLKYFPTITVCTMVNRSVNARASGLLRRLQSQHKHVGFRLLSSSNPEDSSASIPKYLREGDLVICATSATTPLFSGEHVRTGAHIILIGSYTPQMREVERSLVNRALLTGRVLVDSKEACLKEAGELIDAGLTEKDLTELGELIPLNGDGSIDEGQYQALVSCSDKPFEAAEATFDGPVTLFKSVGLGIQDAAIAKAVVEKAESSSMATGTVIEAYD